MYGGCVPSAEVWFFSSLALISLLLLLFLFTAFGSSFLSPAPLTFSFLRAAILAADRLRALGAGAGGGLPSKKRMSSPSEKPRPRVGAWGVAGVRGATEAALGDISEEPRPRVGAWGVAGLRGATEAALGDVSEEEEEGANELCTFFWI